MSIKIHHGPNGAFKTSGAIQDDVIPAIKQGRVIISNVRGLTIDSVLAEFPDAPESLQVINIDTDTSEGLRIVRNWFTWAPAGAFMLFDEAQKLFLKAWGDRDLKQFDYEGGPDAAQADNRPADWLDAWTRHRHWNWDVILTTPNIRYLRDDIRFTCEMAYHHFNKAAILGRLGRGKYKETAHSAQDNKPDDQSFRAQKRIEQRTFRLYSSTATGVTTDTIAGFNILTSPKILLLGGGALYLLVSTIWANGGSVLPQLGPAPTAPKAVPVAASPGKPVPAQAADVAPGADRSAVSDRARDLADPFAGMRISIKANLVSKSKGVVYVFEVRGDDDVNFMMTSRDIAQAGYAIEPRGYCAADLLFEGVARTVVCSGRLGGGGDERLGAERGATAAVAAVADPQDGQPSKPGHGATYLPHSSIAAYRSPVTDDVAIPGVRVAGITNVDGNIQ